MPAMTDDLPREHGFEPLEIEGVLPEGLVGTLYRNGPMANERFGARTSHVFEGDGGLCAVRFDGRGGATGAARILRTRGYLEEGRAGRRLYGSAAPWPIRFTNQLRGRIKNTANTHVVSCNGQLLALMEVAPPTEVDPDTLEVIGETDLDGAVATSFSAHPHHVAALDTWFNFGLAYGRRPHLDLFAWPAGEPCRRIGRVDLDRNVMVHDFIATEDHLVFFVGPAEVVLWRTLLAIGTFDRLLRWAPDLGTEVVVVPLAAPDRPIRFRTEAFWVWHFANAFTEGDEIVVDYARYPDLGSLQVIGRGGPVAPPIYHRARIDLVARTLASDPVADLVCEFPRIHPRVAGRRHQAAWTHATDRGCDGIARIDLATSVVQRHALPEGWSGSEPVFVPSPGAEAETEGHVLVLQYDPDRHRSAVAVYDAEGLDAGPVARAWFDHHVPLTFHGSWVAA